MRAFSLYGNAHGSGGGGGNREKESMKIYFVGLIALHMCGAATAGDLSAVVHHYHYQDYTATLADGRVI